MKITLHIDDQKAAFFLELLQNFKRFVRVEKVEMPKTENANDILAYAGIFQDLEEDVFQSLTTELTENRLAMSRTAS